MHKIFSNVSSKMYHFLFLDSFYRIYRMNSIFVYPDLLYFEIFAQSKFVVIFLHVYVLYINLYLNKLYNF